MSPKRALKEILNYTDAEILQNFQEIRLETAVAAELENTTAIIKRTGIFDATDKSYGEPGASYDQAQGGDNAENGDAGGKETSVQYQVKKATSYPQNAENIVILMHDIDICGVNITALEEIIDFYQEKGASFAVITENSPPLHHRPNN